MDELRVKIFFVMLIGIFVCCAAIAAGTYAARSFEKRKHLKGAMLVFAGIIACAIGLGILFNMIPIANGAFLTQCENCGETVYTNYCHNCGEPAGKFEVKVCPDCDRITSHDYCGNCGKETSMHKEEAK